MNVISLGISEYFIPWINVLQYFFDQWYIWGYVLLKFKAVHVRCSLQCKPINNQGQPDTKASNKILHQLSKCEWSIDRIKRIQRFCCVLYSAQCIYVIFWTFYTRDVYSWVFWINSLYFRWIITIQDWVLEDINFLYRRSFIRHRAWPLFLSCFL